MVIFQILEYLGGIETYTQTKICIIFLNDFRIPRRDWNIGSIE